jgi:hypothetical protein
LLCFYSVRVALRGSEINVGSREEESLMHRFITLACAVTAATLVVVGCGSSDDSSSPSSGGSGGSSSDAQCKGDYADLTQSVFTAQVSASGKCVSDVTTLCSNDVTTDAENCGSDCFKMNAKDQDGCVTTCLASTVTPALSNDCTSCYVADIACARSNCLISCGTAPASQGCADCRVMYGCVAAFYPCSGLPMPGGGGSVGAGGDTSTTAGGVGGAG